MDRFILGVITGMGALVAPLLLGSLFLPGPEGTNLRTGATITTATAPSTPAVETESASAETASGPEMVAYEMPALGVSIDLPANWDVVKGPALTGEATEQRIKDALSVARKGPLQQAAPHHLRIAYGDGPMLDVRLPIGIGIKRLIDKHPTTEITRDASLANLGPFSGGYAAVRRKIQTADQQITIDGQIWIVEIDDGWLSVLTTVTDDDPRNAETMQKVLDSLRRL